jgi:hypothetical protein
MRRLQSYQTVAHEDCSLIKQQPMKITALSNGGTWRLRSYQTVAHEDCRLVKQQHMRITVLSNSGIWRLKSYQTVAHEDCSLIKQWHLKSTVLSSSGTWRLQSSQTGGGGRHLLCWVCNSGGVTTTLVCLLQSYLVCFVHPHNIYKNFCIKLSARLTEEHSKFWLHMLYSYKFILPDGYVSLTWQLLRPLKSTPLHVIEFHFIFMTD